MIIDSLLAMVLSGFLATMHESVPPGWALDWVVVAVSYEVELTVESASEPDFDATPLPSVSRNFASSARHPWLVTGWPLDFWRLHDLWGIESQYEGAGGVYSFSRHPLGLGWDLRLAVVHEFAPTHNQEARWVLTHGLF